MEVKLTTEVRDKEVRLSVSNPIKLVSILFSAMTILSAVFQPIK